MAVALCKTMTPESCVYTSGNMLEGVVVERKKWPKAWCHVTVKDDNSVGCNDK